MPQRRTDQTLCPSCNQQMRLIHSVPERDGLPEFNSLRCHFCNEMVTYAVAPGYLG